LIACGLLVSACGSDDADSNNGTPDAGQDVAQDDVQADTPSPDAPPSDTGNDVTSEAGPCTDVTSVSGSVIDESDAAYGGVGLVLCIYQQGGIAKCLSPTKSSAAGTFDVDMPGDSTCLESASYQLRADDLAVTPLYCPVDVTGGGAITTPGPDRLVSVPACTRDPLGAEADAHEVTAPDGVSMTVVPGGLWLFDFAYEDLRLRRWDATKWGWPCFVDPSNAPEDLAVFAPEMEVRPDAKDAVHVSFPNEAGLAAGTVVDLYGLGGAATSLWDGEDVHEGAWEIIGEAQVSSDGARIETRPGEGLPFATWVGWKQK
jgi:hypothetical protein